MYMLDLNMPDFENKKFTAFDYFHGNGLCGKILTKKEQSEWLDLPQDYIPI